MQKCFVIAIALATVALSASATKAQYCGAAEGVRRVGVSNMNNNCSGARFNTDNCYEAARVFVAVNGKNMVCPEVDKAQLRADLAVARRLERFPERLNLGIPIGWRM
jgi:hypothetical protein